VPRKVPSREQDPPAELALIEHIRARASTLPSRSLRLGIGDDCAILTPPPGQELLVTTDFSLEGRHFLRNLHAAESVGHRTLARGLSDLAAMGASPLACFLSLALPKSVAGKGDWLDGFLNGLLGLAKAHNLPLAGGDTSQSPSDHILADITLLGAAPAGRSLRRAGAQVGDLIYVTGSLGGSATEFAALSSNSRKFRAAKASGDHPHLFPRPRLAVGQALLKRGLATACIDVSDGLSTDLAHLCSASGVAAEIDAALLPAHPLTAHLDEIAQIAAILHGGEDYELLFSAAASTRVPRAIAGVPITRIGRVVRSQKSRPQMTIVADGTSFELEPRGWEHLK
jgi:thiamine-monophosphate kinase